MIPIEIPPNTIMLRGIGYDSNVYLFRDGKEGVIIDTGTGIYWHRYFEVFEREGYLDDLEKVTILNTHEHFDHTGGNRKFRELLEKRSIEVKFAAHRLTADAIEKGDDYVILSYAYGRRFIPHMVNVKLNDGDIIEVGGKKLEVIHTPGSIEDLIESLKKLRHLDVYIALPGHGKPITNWKENFEAIKKALGEF